VWGAARTSSVLICARSRRGLVVFVVVLIGVAALAVGVAREGTRHLVGIAAGVLVAASLLSLVLANLYGLEAK
jgi:hypothetical protein